MPSDPIPERVLQRRRAIGERIRLARMHAGLTQEQVAEQADLHRTTIVRIEAGTTSPLLDHLLLIADAVGVPLEQLVQEQSQPFEKMAGG